MGARLLDGYDACSRNVSGLLEDERTQTLFRPFVGFFDLEPHVPDELPANVDALLDEDAALIPRLILVLRKLAHIRQADAAASWPAHRTKVGLNEPCPCGSGYTSTVVPRSICQAGSTVQSPPMNERRSCSVLRSVAAA
jgi:hypothetical protein